MIKINVILASGGSFEVFPYADPVINSSDFARHFIGKTFQYKVKGDYSKCVSLDVYKNQTLFCTIK